MLLQLTLISDEPIFFPIDKCAIVESKNGDVIIIFDGKNYSIKEKLTEVLYLLAPEPEIETKVRDKLN